MLVPSSIKVVVRLLPFTLTHSVVYIGGKMWIITGSTAACTDAKLKSFTTPITLPTLGTSVYVYSKGLPTGSLSLNSRTAASLRINAPAESATLFGLKFRPSTILSPRLFIKSSSAPITRIEREPSVEPSSASVPANAGTLTPRNITRLPGTTDVAAHASTPGTRLISVFKTSSFSSCVTCQRKHDHIVFVEPDIPAINKIQLSLNRYSTHNHKSRYGKL